MPRLEIDSERITLYDETGQAFMEAARGQGRDEMMADMLEGAECPVFANVVRSLNALSNLDRS